MDFFLPLTVSFPGNLSHKLTLASPSVSSNSHGRVVRTSHVTMEEAYIWGPSPKSPANSPSQEYSPSPLQHTPEDPLLCKEMLPVLEKEEELPPQLRQGHPDQRYELTQRRAHGSYGVVWEGVHIRTGTKVAIKQCEGVFDAFERTKGVKVLRLLRELKLLTFLSAHEQVVTLLDIIVSDKKEWESLYIVFELMDMDLRALLGDKSQTMTEEHHQYFLYELLRGMVFIHSAGVIHRDLKPANILVSRNCDLKLCDFGLSRSSEITSSQESKMTEYVVTRWYRPPEILCGWPEYSSAVDIWSVGCILAEMLLGHPILKGNHAGHQIQLIVQLLGSPSEKWLEQYPIHHQARCTIVEMGPFDPVPWKVAIPKAPTEALDLVSRMLKWDPEERISVGEALDHPWMARLHDPCDEPRALRQFSFAFEKGNETMRDYREQFLRASLIYTPMRWSIENVLSWARARQISEQGMQELKALNVDGPGLLAINGDEEEMQRRGVHDKALLQVLATWELWFGVGRR